MFLIVSGEPNAYGPCVTLLFGGGVVGDAVRRALSPRALESSVQRFDWTWPKPYPFEELAIERAVHAALAAQCVSNIAVVWAAGRNGFGATEEEMNLEFIAFKHVVELTVRLGDQLAPKQCCFVHVSSAGGLFEGQVACCGDKEPAPLRPYGHGKLAQERYLFACPTIGRRVVVRPSSVYGYVPGGRLGLISALVVAALQRKDATIFGALTTQRDYVFALDVGKFIATRLLEPWSATPNAEPEVFLLASGRPASVFEVLYMVRDQLGLPLSLRIEPRPENALDNTFRPSALPLEFHPTGLQEGVMLTASAVINERYRGNRL